MDISDDVSKLQSKDGGGGESASSQTPSIARIEQFLKAKDDTSRFVGLALLKSTLDTSDELRGDKEVVASLWGSIPIKFLERLLRTGAKPGAKQTNAKDMLDLAVAVIYTFAILLPEDTRSDAKLLGLVPLLVEAVLQSSEETTMIILKTLLTLVSSSPRACTTVAEVEDWSPFIEIAPKQPLVLSIFAWSWINGEFGNPEVMRQKIDNGISALVASFKGTDGVTLLDFISKVLNRLDYRLIPQEPKWLEPLTDFIRTLSTAQPTAASREAYTNCAANLLVTYPSAATTTLFKYGSTSSKPFSYLFINLILIDIRSSLPSLMEKLNTPEYPLISERLTSALIILSFFINFLLEQMELEEADTTFSSTFHMTPDLIMKLNSAIGDTLSIVIEYLRDRWDAAVAGVQGLHPEARYGESHTATGSHKTLAWDSKHEPASEDRLLLAALRVLGDWLREDDGEVLRSEATSLMDLYMDLYRPDTAVQVAVTARPLVLGVLDGIIQTDDGVRSLLEHNGWSILTKDLILILKRSSASDRLECELGQHIAAILSTLVESRNTTPEEWLDLVTGVSAYSVPSADSQPSIQLQQFWADLLQLASILLIKSPPGVKRQYVHSAAAIVEIAAAMRQKKLADDVEGEITDVMASLSTDSVFGAAMLKD